MKRPKPSSENSDETKLDFISKLTDALLIEILSLLPAADANRMRILSSRWKYICALLPDLHFFMPYCSTIESVNRFHDTVDETLALRGDLPIQRFFLDCPKECDYNRFYDSLITIVIQCTVKEVDLMFPDDRFSVRFCWDLFKTCNTLVRLTLKGQFMLDVPKSKLLFPGLKILRLFYIVYSGDKSFENLISGCPVLMHLVVIRTKSDNLRSLKVFLPSLKRFVMYFFQDLNVVINAPKLEDLYVHSIELARFSFTEPLSLVEARIRETYGSIIQLINGLLSVRIMTLDDSAMEALSNTNNLHRLMFPNLIKLVIDNHRCRGLLLAGLLYSMPKLEHITLSYHEFNEIQHLPEGAPACLRLKMKAIIVLSHKTVEDNDLPLIRYLLKHSNKLEMFTLNAHKISLKRREEILNFDRGSKTCQVEFV